MLLRAATEADAETAAALIIADDVASLGEADYTLGDLRAEWQEPGFELAHDTAVIEDEAGAIVAYAHFRGRDALAVVDPNREGEGFGSRLLAWVEQRGAERGQGPLRQAVGHLGESARELLEQAGWAQTHHFWRLERAVDPADAEPGGLRPVAPGDATGLHAVYAAAFDDPHDEPTWMAREFEAHGVDLELSRTTEDRRGFALVRRWPEDVLYVALLAVHPDAAGRGLGSALLKGVFAAAREAGQRVVQLNVAAANATAVRLYERVGMSQRWRVDAYEKPLPD